MPSHVEISNFHHDMRKEKKVLQMIPARAVAVRIPAGVIMLGILVFSGGCKKSETSDATPAVSVEVRTTPVMRGSVEETVDATGETHIQREVQLRSSINGILVSFKYFNGDKIPKGSVIAQIRSKEAQAAFQGAEVLLHSAQTEEQREEARKAYELAEQSSATVAVTAPFDGILANREKNEMEVIAEGDLIANLVDPSSIVFVADVPVASLHFVRTGQQVHLKFSGTPRTVLTGTVRLIEPLMNPNDQTAHVKILFSPPAEVLMGSMFGEASIVTGERTNALLVPKKALLVDDENNSVSVMEAGRDSLAHRVVVRVTWQNDSLAAIAAPGISESTDVIIEGQYGLPDSTSIRVKH